MSQEERRCPHCRICRATDEMRKHPSYTSIGTVERMLEDAMQYNNHIERMCPAHQDHRQRRYSLLLIGHWVTLITWKFEHRQSNRKAA